MSNSGFPWFPFYARDWLTDSKVLLMSCCARGAFVHLLALQWENEGLPNDWRKLSELTGYGEHRNEDLLEEELGACFEVGDDGLLRNPRLEELRAEKLAKRAAQSSGARLALSNRRGNLPVRAYEDHDSDTDTDEEKKKKPSSVRKRTGVREFLPIFETFWSFYPKRNEKRVGKKSTWNRFQRLSDSDRQDACRAADNYSKSKIARVDGKARDPERFLKDDYWRDWLDGPGTDEHVEERDRIPPPTPEVDQGGPAVDPSDVADELGHRSLLDATRALSMDERLKREEGR